ncbi:MAG: T9SS type A sorting domain-containing protein, partial [Bacteroidales bacterium]|nr:T9SS type A sorting domain-containing protein [Bacteroidales bacterium]
YINEAMVTVADIEADNGVVHVIDAVLLPPSTSGIGTITEEKFNLSVYPNPANDYIEISLDNVNATELKVEIINTSGLSVSNNIPLNSASLTLELDSFLPGIYFVRISGNNTIETKRFVIAR